jgi:PKD repeat protein
VEIIINNAPTVFAGLDKEVCEGSSILMSDATFGGSTISITWSGGAGSFTPSTSTLLTTYTPDSTETGTTVTLYIETNDPVGPCVAARDSVDIAVNIAPLVYAGATKVVCGQDSVRLNDANFGGSTSSVTWSGGAGTFYPDPNTLNAVYFPTAGEIGSMIILTITSDDPAGPCDIVSDQVDVYINTPPAVDAGVDQIVCESSEVELDGSIGGGASSATWSGGLGTFDDDTDLNTSYFPDSTEIGTIVTLRLTTDDPAGPCSAIFAEVNITIEEAPVVDAGLDQAICIGDTLFLNGSIGGSASSAIWSGGIGTYSNINDLNAYYLPDTTERGSQIIFTLTTDDPAGPCPASDDRVFNTIHALPNPTFFGLDPQVAINDPPISLDGSPAGGIFTGDGIDPPGSNMFNPSTAGEGRAYVTYTYMDGNGCTNLYLDSTFVNPLPDIEFGGLDFAYCHDDDASMLTGIPEGGVFEGPGIAQQGSDYYFDPDFAGVGIHTIRYIFTDPVTLVTDTTEGTTRVLPVPVAGFTFDANNTCVEDSIQFLDLSTIDTSILADSITNYFWIFPDTTYAVQNPYHKFSEASQETIKLTVESEGFLTKSCFSEYQEVVRVGGVPQVDFYSEFISEGSATNFYSNISFPTSDHEFNEADVSQWLWDFDDNGATSSLQDPFYTFSGAGQYSVSLNVLTNRGCTGDTVKVVSIVPSYIVGINSPYCEDFEINNGGWAISPNPGVAINSWEYGQPSGPEFDHAFSGNFAWVTQLNDPYYDGDSSYLITPAFNIDSLDRPMLSFYYWAHMVGTDGVVLQYSEDGGLTWSVVGSLVGTEPNGIRWWGNEWWYNRENISADPGPQGLDPTNNVGWSLETDGWVNARISLDQISDPSAVIFRFAFASVETSVPNTFDGFAIDDFCIKNRTRNVLVEHFVNFEENTLPGTSDLYQDVLEFIPNELVYIEYHHGFNGGDQIYYENQILGDRANYYSAYGTTSTSFKSFVDGIPQSDGLVFDYYEVIYRSLIDPKVSIDITVDDAANIPDDQIEIEVRTTALEDISDDVSLFITLVEDNFGSYYHLYPLEVQNLARAMFKDTPTYSDGLAGMNIKAPWNINDPEKVFYIPPSEIIRGFETDPTGGDEYWVVAYIQDNTTNEILQAEIIKVDNEKDITTGLEEDLSRGILENLKIYPQPAKEYAIVEFGDLITQDYDWEIMDQRGVSIGRGTVQKGSKGFEIDTGLLPNGIHFLLIGDKEGLKLHRKLTIIH